jgi:uncharacterized protein YgiM (DUF1202 family)
MKFAVYSVICLCVLIATACSDVKNTIHEATRPSDSAYLRKINDNALSERNTGSFFGSVENQLTCNVAMGNVRSGPSINDRIINNISRGQSVRVKGHSGKWFLIVSEDDITGWAHESLFFSGADSTVSDKSKNLGKKNKASSVSESVSKESDKVKIVDKKNISESLPESVTNQKNAGIRLRTWDSEPVKVYEGPSLFAKVVGTIPADTDSILINIEKDFFFVRYMDVKGYIHKDFTVDKN